jgi:hypothetical protein
MRAILVCVPITRRYTMRDLSSLQSVTIRTLDYLLLKGYFQLLNKARREYLAIMKGGD